MEKKESAIIVIGTRINDVQVELIRKKGHKIIFYKNIEKDYTVDHADYVEELDLNNEAHVLEKSLALTKVFDVKTVFSINEYRVPLAARISEVLELPCHRLSYEAAMNCKNKKLTREILNREQVSPTRFALVRSVSEAMEALPEFTLPVIVKPCNDSGSMHVYRCDTVYQVKYAVSMIRHHKNNWAGQPYDPDIIIEEFLEGPEFSVESCTIDGKTTIFAITSKLTTATNLSIEVGQNVPALLTDEQREEMCSVVKNSIAALGIDYASTHTEVKLTPRGTRVVEVNSRPGHDRIHLLVLAVTGYNMRELALHIALGGTLEDAPRHKAKAKSASSRFFIAEKDGSVEYSDVSPLKTDPLLEEFELYVNRGDQVKETVSNYGRLGHFVAYGTDEKDSHQVASEIIEKVGFRII